jgi:outer membrane autotransporter protein
MERQRRQRRFLTGSAAVALAIAPAPMAWAQTTWTGGNGTTDWSDNANWSNNAPTAVDTATLNGSGATQPTLTASSAAGTLSMSGNTLTLGGNTLTAGTVNLTGGTITGTGTLSVGTLNMSGGSIGVSAVVDVGAGTINLSGGALGSIAGTGILNVNGSATKEGSGGNFSGATNINNGGTLQMLGPSALSPGATTVAAGGTLDLNNFSNSVGSLAGAGDVTLRSATLTSGGNDTTTTFSGVLSGTGGLTKIGTGTMTLSAANTYSGNTTVNAGTLGLGTGGSLSSSTALVINGGTFDLNGHTQTVGALSGGAGGTLALGSGALRYDPGSGSTSFGGTITGTGSLTIASGELELSGINTYTGGTTNNSNLQIRGGSILGGVTNNGELIFTNSSTITFSNVVSGSGSVRQYGNGTTVLTGASTYAGLTTVQDGTIRIGIDGALPSGTTLNTGAGTLDLDGHAQSVGRLIGNGNVALGSGGSLTVNGSSSDTFGGVISGAGNLTKSGSGQLILTNTNTFTGTVTMGGGTLAVSSDANLGNSGNALVFNGGTLRTTAGLTSSRSIALSGAGTVDVDTSQTTSLTGVIGGTGGLTKTGSGILTLSGTNTYGGTTTVNAGTLQAGATNTFSSSSATTVAGVATLDLNNFSNSVGSLAGAGNVTLGSGTLTAGGNDSTTTFSGVISGSGGLTKQGTGTLTLSGTNTYGGPTTVNAGTLQAGAANTFSSSSYTEVAGGATLDLNNFSNSVGLLIGAGNVTLGSGMLTAGVNNINTSFSGIISGTGGLIKQGGGTLTLQGANTYTGGTTINAGSLQLVGGSLASTGALTVNTGGTFDLNGQDQTVGALAGSGGTINLGSGTLTAGDDNDTSFAGVIGGSGSLTKAGTGTLTLSGTNTYTGMTAVDAGTLALNGSVDGNATVAAGATIMGSGTVGGNLGVAGTIAPGNSIGTFTVGGNYSQSAGSTYTVEVNAAGQSDRIVVTGSAALAGSVAVQAQSGIYQRNTRYTILTAGGSITGTYSGVTSNFAFLTPSLGYSSNAVTLMLQSTSTSFQDGARTGNQRAVGAALDQASPTATGDFADVLNTLYGLSTSQGPQVLNTLGGQTYSGLGSMLVLGSQAFMNGFQLQAGGGGGSTYQALKADDGESCDTACDVEPLWGAWGGGVGAFGTVAGDANAAGTTYTLGGFMAGLDRKLAPTFRAGVATGFNAANLYANGLPGTGTSNTLQVALYGAYLQDAFYLDALAGYAHSDNRMTRPIVIPGLPYRSAQGYTTANTFFGQLEAGYKLVIAPSFGGFATPFARLQASTSTQDGFSETGADSLNLTVAAQTTQSLRTVTGAQLGAAIDAPWRETLNVTMRLGWSHEFADTTRPVNAAFAGAPTVGFTTFGAQAPRDGVVLGLGANTQVAERINIYLRYDGDLAGGNTSHVLSAGARYVW